MNADLAEDRLQMVLHVWREMKSCSVSARVSSPAMSAATTWRSRYTGLPRAAKVTFTTPGTYNYVCLLHTFMTGQIVVV